MSNARKMLAATAVLCFTICALACEADACSTFILRSGKEILYGRNFDFFLNDGYVFTNQRGVAKTALTLGSRHPAQWVSKHGSVTFNQTSKEYPYGGINETGLVVEIMWLEGTKYPARDERAEIPELAWVQYQLDNCATVAEVIATDKAIRIEPAGQPVHFLVVDRAGGAAAIEFLDGAMVVHTGKDLVVPALTNSTYDQSAAGLAGYEGFGGTKKLARTYDSLDRFATIATMLEDRGAMKRAKAVPYAFAILDSVGDTNGTVWSIVYDLKDLTITFKSVGNRDRRFFKMADFDFDCATPSKALGIDAPGKGHVAKLFTDYTTEINRETVMRTFGKYREQKFLDLPDAALEYLAGYPATLPCQSSGAK